MKYQFKTGDFEFESEQRQKNFLDRIIIHDMVCFVTNTFQL